MDVTLKKMPFRKYDCQNTHLFHALRFFIYHIPHKLVLKHFFTEFISSQFFDHGQICRHRATLFLQKLFLGLYNFSILSSNFLFFIPQNS